MLRLCSLRVISIRHCERDSEHQTEGSSWRLGFLRRRRTPGRLAHASCRKSSVSLLFDTWSVKLDQSSQGPRREPPLGYVGARCHRRAATQAGRRGDPSPISICSCWSPLPFLARIERARHMLVIFTRAWLTGTSPTATAVLAVLLLCWVWRDGLEEAEARDSRGTPAQDRVAHSSSLHRGGSSQYRFRRAR